MRFVGIDYGTKRVGIALSDEQGQFAKPSLVLPNDSRLLPEIKKFCIENQAEGVVIGESRDLDGKENPIMPAVRLLRDALERDLKIRVFLEPEFYTSREASRVQGKTDMHDASAAALILKSYLDRHNNGHI